MIEERAVVVALDGEIAWVEARRDTLCGACATGGGCGASLFAKALGFKAPRLRVPKSDAMAVGDRVILGIDERALVRGSFAAYVVPIVLLLILALIGEAVASRWLALNSELLAVVFGMCGLALGFAWLRRHTQRLRLDGRYQPVILRREENVITPHCARARN